MTRPKYLKDRQIYCMAEFEQSESQWYRVQLGRWHTFHRSMLMSQQYRTLANWIAQGRVYETKLRGEGNE